MPPGLAMALHDHLAAITLLSSILHDCENGTISERPVNGKFARQKLSFWQELPPTEAAGIMQQMQILLTDDDGVYAQAWRRWNASFVDLGDVVVVAPATEQSGVGHSIAYLTPLIVKEVFRTDGRYRPQRPLGLCRGRQPGRLRENRRSTIFPLAAPTWSSAASTAG